MLGQQIPMIETIAITETFVSGLGEVQDAGGGCLRFIFYSKHVGPDGREERHVADILIAPTEAVMPAILKAAKAIGVSLVVELAGRRH